MSDAADRRVDESDTSGPLAFCGPSYDAVFTRDLRIFLELAFFFCHFRAPRPIKTCFYGYSSY